VRGTPKVSFQGLVLQMNLEAASRGIYDVKLRLQEENMLLKLVRAIFLHEMISIVDEVM
jgi:hypothetical protein